MARCSHRNPCDCDVKAGPGIDITGTGSANDPYLVALNPVQGQGIAYNRETGELSARLSTDAGNTLSFGGDGGLFDAGGGGGESGGITIDGWPTDRLLFIGRKGGGPLVQPYDTPESIRAAVDQRLDGVHFDVFALSDGTPAIAPFTTLSSWTTTEDRDTPPEMMTLAAWRTLYVDVGDPVEPMDGWWGFRQPPFHGGPTVARVMPEVARRVVMLPELQSEAAGPGLLQLIQRFQAQRSALVIASDPAWLTGFINANVATALKIDDPAAHPAQSVIDAGISWVVLDRDRTDEEITSYVSAGLQVLMIRMSRHIDAQRCEELGARGSISNDPQYFSRDPKRYHLADSTAAWRTLKTPLHGMISFLQEGNVPGLETYLNARGTLANDDQGWTLTTNWPEETGEQPFFSLLAGFLHPPPNPQKIVVDAYLAFTEASNQNIHLGLVVGVADDGPMKDPADINGYVVGIRADGRYFIWKFPGASSGFDELAAATRDPFNIGTNYWWRVTVDATAGITFEHPSGDEIITSPDTTFAGNPYVYLYRNDQNVGAGGAKMRFTDVKIS